MSPHTVLSFKVVTLISMQDACSSHVRKVSKPSSSIKVSSASSDQSPAVNFNDVGYAVGVIEGFKEDKVVGEEEVGAKVVGEELGRGVRNEGSH